MRKETVDWSTFGERLAYTRKQKGLTRNQLAELIGVKPNTVSCWIRRHPRASMVQKMVTALGLPEDWFENDNNFKDQNFKPVKKLPNFGKYLAFTRRKRGLLQRQLAELIGVDIRIVGAWESDQRYPDMSKMQRIIQALDVSEDWFENDDNFKGQDFNPVKKLTDFGKRLAYTRKEKGLLQRQLAELIGVVPQTVSLWESDTCYPAMSKIQKIIKALELPEDWFKNDDNFRMESLTEDHENRKLTKEQQQLVIDNEYIIYLVLKKYNLTPFKEDMWDIGEIGLCKAAQHWNQKSRFSFFTVAFDYIKWEFNTEGRKDIKCLSPKISLDQPIDNSNPDSAGDTFGSLIPDPDDEWEHLEYRILVESVCQKVAPVLSPMEKVAFNYWLHGKKNTEIAKAMGTCYQSASDFVLVARKKCRAAFNPDEIFS